MKLEELKEPESFTLNPFYERLLHLRETNPKAFDSISPASKLSLLKYEALWREAKTLIEDEGLPSAA